MISLRRSFWYRDVSEMGYGPSRHVITRKVGRYRVRTWLNHDGRPVCTGWFEEA